jgi:hypothetical protein
MDASQVKPGYLYEVMYPWGKGKLRGWGRVTPAKHDPSPTGFMYIITESGGVGYDKVEDLEIVREICKLDQD